MEELDAYFQLHQVATKEAITIAALHLRGMARDWWFKIYVSCYHENVKTCDEFTKGLLKKFYGSQCESSCSISSNTLHAREGNMKQTPLHISRGEENWNDDLLEARPPLYEGHSSICEVMEVLPSREDQGLGSLLDDEVISIINGEDEHKRTNNAIMLGGDPSPHGGERGAIYSMRGVLVSMQGIRRISTCGNHGTILKSFAATCGDCEMEEEEKDQQQGLIHPYLLWRIFAQGRETVYRSEERDKSVLLYIQSTSELDVSLYGGIPPGRPPDLELMRGILSFSSPLLDSEEVEKF